METGQRHRILEDSIENIGAIVEFEDEEDESDPETNALVSSINEIINLNIDFKELSDENFGHKNLKGTNASSNNNDIDYEISIDQTKKCESKFFLENDSNIYENIPTPNIEDISAREGTKKNDEDIGSDCYGYENVQQSPNAENEYEEINFDTHTIKTKNNYVEFASLPKKRYLEKPKNIFDGIVIGKDVKAQRRRWSLAVEEDDQPQTSRPRAWSLKNGQTIKSILKQNKQTEKNAQSVNFRSRAKVKTFREAFSSVYEPIDVVDYVLVKGEDLDDSDTPKSKIQCLLQPSTTKEENSVSTQTENKEKAENCLLM